ncbi:MAG: 3'-5' exonuclease [Anaerolineales bacterium]|jgi:DNA polymerase III epsilon subunit-like protein
MNRYEDLGDANQVETSEFFVSVDVETAGPNPSQYSLLTIGACTLNERPRTFYVELQPVNDKMTSEAFAIHHLDLRRLADKGMPPAKAMRSFEDWLVAETPQGKQPVFISFDAPFEWMFVNDYFHRFLGKNPFGTSALDIKAFFMGMSGALWSQTSMQTMLARYLNHEEITHHALRDALDQAEIFAKMLEEVKSAK